MKPKDIFGLAVRLLGLVFLYFCLRGVAGMLDLDILETPDKNEIANDLMPIVFNLVVALWLLHGKLLIKLAYPEPPKIPENVPPQPKRTAPSPESVSPPELTGMERAEKKLAALVEKSKET
jgi:hypothetical protein